ncbi:hypothetical protein K503DRAFT_372314 [Rhizopogon vinicolor AM-OR11-026]|uniref:Uncharacterized protein n=1 Tax=Rhizopogon vinicolor AM-OR11-026 TaxID=1314800 RepID=A0A1B7MS01_9AGAM|nr:hypothetical protein K503DRAFT_372314 [Rhizopogon vinicolor AM-OR11-026]
MITPNIPNVPCNFHHQAPCLYPTNSGTAQYPQDINNVQQSFAGMSRPLYPMNIVPVPWPVSADINVLLAREDADWNHWVRPPPQFNSTPTEPNEAPLRATLPAPVLNVMTMDMAMKNNIIPIMVHQRLIDLRDTRVFYTRPYFTMPDTSQYAQFSSPASASTVATRQYYSKVPRNPCFPGDLKRPRIYPIELLKRLPKHLKTYQAAFPRPLPIVIIRRNDIVATIPDVVRWMHGAIYYTVPDFGDQSNPDEPEDNLFSMVIKRGISSWNRPFTPLGAEIATSPVLLGNMLYEAEELNFFNYAVNVFLELPRLPGPTLKEPLAMYTGAFILRVMNHAPLVQERWDELSVDRKLDIYNRAPDFFEGPPPPWKRPEIPAVGLYFQNWDMNMLGVLDDLKFEKVDDPVGSVASDEK